MGHELVRIQVVELTAGHCFPPLSERREAGIQERGHGEGGNLDAKECGRW